MRAIRHAVLAGALVACTAVGSAQTSPSQPASPATTNGSSAAEAAVSNGYVIGPGDVLGIVFWREASISGDAVVLPDGRITIPLLNEIPAAGLKPEELRARIVEAARKFVTDPTATVVVRQINSRMVHITGMVAKPASYPLNRPLTVLQLIATAGGLLEYAKADEIVVIRSENGRQGSYRFNYKEVSRQKNLQQNIELKPGDTVIVP
jgi:polysaccharide export outer membrane protein